MTYEAFASTPKVPSYFLLSVLPHPQTQETTDQISITIDFASPRRNIMESYNMQSFVFSFFLRDLSLLYLLADHFFFYC